MTVTVGYSPAELLSLSDEAFQKLVEIDMRRPDDGEELRAALRDREVIDRTYSTLLTMQKKVEGTLAARRQDMEALRARCLAKGPRGKAEWDQASEKHAAQRAGSLRFKVGLEESLMDVRRLRENHRSVLFENEANARLYQRVSALEAAIRKHRGTFEADDEPSDDDVELWAWLPED